MAQRRNTIRFLLNNEHVELTKVSPSDTLLDFLRLQKHLRGTKEGCAEGDCGACTVLVGRLWGDELVYETVNACIRFIASLDGCHIVTIEHLKKDDGSLHPVQQAMLEHHGSQCGFCTPGIVMSLYALWMNNPHPKKREVETALQGNLCRCTGYEPIFNAALNVSKLGQPECDPLILERQTVLRKLKEIHDGKTLEIEADGQHLLAPASVDDLAAVRSKHPSSTIVAGSTDVGLWVTKQMRDISPAIFVGNIEGLRKINVTDEDMTIGAGVSYSDLHELIQTHLPQLSDYWSRIGGEQVRNMGTVGGNIANGSPIGDTPPPLIALGSEITLRCGSKRRVLPLEEFFVDYGKQDRVAGDFIESIRIPLPDDDEFLAAYKISKRRDEDISAVAFSCLLKLDGSKVSEIVIACGGLAATPKRARTVERFLIGKEWSEETIKSAAAKFREDYTPLSDWRASAAYRLRVTENLLLRFFYETNGQHHGLRLEQAVSG